MSRLKLIRMMLVVGAFSVFLPVAIAQHEHPAGDPAKLGKVNFPVSRDASVRAQFRSTVALSFNPRGAGMWHGCGTCKVGDDRLEKKR